MIRSNSVPRCWQDLARGALLPAVLLLFLVTSTFGQVQYAITDLGTLGGTTSYAYGINNSGQIVGWADTTTAYRHAFLYSGSGPIQDLGTLGGGNSFAYGINDSGQVVGEADISAGYGNYHAFLYSGSGPMQDLGTFGGVGSSASDINNSGQIVGRAGTSAGNGNYHAFLYSGSGPMQDLGTLGGPSSYAWGINKSGQIVGRADTDGGDIRAFVFSGSGPMQDLGTLGGQASAPGGINNSGQIVGSAITSGNPGYYHAFLYSGSGPMQDLGTLGGTYSHAWGINETGQIVGFGYTGGGNLHAFVYSGGGPIKDLNNLIAPASGWTLTEATAINDKGQIVGSGINPAGQPRAFLLSPLSTITPGTPPSNPGDGLKPVNPNTTPPSGNLKRWNGSSWDNVTSWTGNGIDPSKPTVVLAHGWNDEISDTNWTASTAHILQLQDNNANILAWDWSNDALSKPGQPKVSVWDDLVAEGLKGAEASAQRGGTKQGKLLANELKNLHISNDKLQLVGHSNGGAVVGQAASELAIGGQKVQRITTLDTPNLRLGQVPQAELLLPETVQGTVANAMKYVHADSASQVEVYFSNGLLGRTAFGFGAPLLDSSATNVFNGRIYPGPAVMSLSDAQNCDHLRIIDWYREAPSRSPGDGEFVAGLNWSILVASGADQWVAGNYTEQGYSRVFGTTTLAQQNVAALRKLTVDGFETGTNWLGQHAEMFMRDVGNFAAKIFPGSDGYLWKDVSVPADAYYLTFDLKIETPGAGDFLTATLGNEIIFYKALNAADSDLWTVDPIFIGDFAGQTDTLLFTLNHVGDGTPSILLDNITFSAVPEPSTFALLGIGAIGLLVYAWRRRQQAT